MYVKTTRVRRGNRVYEYLSLVEAMRDGGRVRHDVVARLGEPRPCGRAANSTASWPPLAAHSSQSWSDGSGVDVQEARSAEVRYPKAA